MWNITQTILCLPFVGLWAMWFYFSSILLISAQYVKLFITGYLVIISSLYILSKCNIFRWNKAIYFIRWNCSNVECDVILFGCFNKQGVFNVINTVINTKLSILVHVFILLYTKIIFFQFCTAVFFSICFFFLLYIVCIYSSNVIHLPPHSIPPSQAPGLQ